MLFCLELVVGVFLCCFGLYEKFMQTLLHFFKNIKKNLAFFIPIAIGIFTSIFICGNLLQLAFEKVHMEISFIFMGLILGSLKLVIKQAEVKKIQLLHILCLFLALSFSLYLVALESSLSFSSYIQSNSFFVIAGILMSAGIVIPGISKTVILMMLGIYNIYLSAITSINLSVLLPIGIGLIIGGILFLVLINFLFKIAKSYTYFAIIGFILGSIPVIYPGFSFDIHGFISIFLFIISFFISSLIARFNK